MKKKTLKDLKHKLPALTKEHQLTEDALQTIVGGQKPTHISASW
ncbi:MAG TPA: bacteriocin [Kofleriaceae bacterium]|nr:bacteriocin [Kofleriaceae bacterium]